MSMLSEKDRVFVAGHKGMVGSAILRTLEEKGFENLITVSRQALDLTNQVAVRSFFDKHQIDYVVDAAARVGGIYANNTYPADFIYENLMMECNLIHQAYQAGVKGLLFLGSSCIYPKFADQPMSENALLKGFLEPTNEPYAIAKIAGIKLCESYNRQYGTDYRSVMPTNLYGANDNFNLQNSHVIPALIRKFHDAKKRNDSSVNVWGTGQVKREFLHVDDMASACVHVMSLPKSEYEKYTEPTVSHINVGTGKDISIRELVYKIQEVTGFEGEVVWDVSKPEGPPRKLLDVHRLADLGWQAKIDLYNGLESTYEWFKANESSIRD